MVRREESKGKNDVRKCIIVTYDNIFKLCSRNGPGFFFSSC